MRLRHSLSIVPDIETLSGRHDRKAFSCGNDRLDQYFQTHASQDQRRKLSVCYVGTLPGENTPVGYYTLSNEAIIPTALPEALVKKLPRYPSIPATLLGRLAVDQKYQGRKFGEFLLLDALNRSLNLSRQIASYAMIVDAANDDATIQFYARYGFQQIFPDRPNRLFMSMGTIAALAFPSVDTAG